MRPGVELLEDLPGSGVAVERHAFYDFRIRMWLSHGDQVTWKQPWGLYDRGRLEDEGATLVTSLRVDRESMFAGLFYGVEGMRVGGVRRLRIAPHLGYGAEGVPDVVPPNALLTVEVSVLSERAV
jgi:hypothetical protein